MNTRQATYSSVRELRAAADKEFKQCKAGERCELDFLLRDVQRITIGEFHGYYWAERAARRFIDAGCDLVIHERGKGICEIRWRDAVDNRLPHNS